MDLWLQNSSLPSATDILLVIATFFVLQPHKLNSATGSPDSHKSVYSMYYKRITTWDTFTLHLKFVFTHLLLHWKETQKYYISNVPGSYWNLLTDKQLAICSS